MATRLAAVAVEGRDVRELARFWAHALGWWEAGDGVVRPEAGGAVELAFVASARPKSAKNRLHLDLSGGDDQAGAVGRLLALGARRADIGQGDVPWEVLADPEGNEFCVLPGADAADGLAQICQDAADPARQGRFWAAATGWSVTERGDWGVRLQPAPGVAPSLVMGPPVAAKPAVNRVQFVLAAREPGDAEDCAAGLVAAGAARTAGPHVFTDPEGNEFRLDVAPRSGRPLR
ncbi:VOC family protein [Streptomyces sp. NPDC020917]|uniref:VOC family protein n=1 Tax=Streptomyces sp. NPDC020917 TaxID=3365102 RepID=UPI00379E44C4